jgi:molybdopterin converting factor small subunit
MVKLVFLGKFGDVADPAEVALPNDVRSLSDLKSWLTRQQPLLGRAIAATTTRLVVNQCVVHDLSTPIADSDEIAFLPPMSGG